MNIEILTTPLLSYFSVLLHAYRSLYRHGFYGIQWIIDKFFFPFFFSFFHIEFIDTHTYTHTVLVITPWTNHGNPTRYNSAEKWEKKVLVFFFEATANTSYFQYLFICVAQTGIRKINNVFCSTRMLVNFRIIWAVCMCLCKCLYSIIV